MNAHVIDCTPAEAAMCDLLIAAMRDGRVELGLQVGASRRVDTLMIDQHAAGEHAMRFIRIENIAAIQAARDEISRRPRGNQR